MGLCEYPILTSAETTCTGFHQWQDFLKHDFRKFGAATLFDFDGAMKPETLVSGYFPHVQENV